MVDWDFVKEILITLLAFIYYFLDGIVRAILPASVYGKDISGETVLVTGSGNGIGRLLAIMFAKHDCKVVLWDVNSEGNEETAEEIKKMGKTCYAYTVDLSIKDDVYKTAEKLKEEVGMVHILVNNAGIVTGKKFLQCSDTMIQKTMQINAMAHFWTVKAFLPDMIKVNHGHVVTIASAAGVLGVNGLADYCASKFAAVGFDESLRFELEVLGKDQVHTTVVCPFYISTGMFEGVKVRFPSLLPVLQPEYVAEKIMDAIRCNRQVLYLPRLLYLILGLKAYLPTKCLAVICNFFGASNLMDSFVGRQKEE